MSAEQVGPRKVVNVVFDEFHSESWTISRDRALEIQPDRPENSSYQTAADALRAREFNLVRNTRGQISRELLSQADVLVFLHPCDPKYEASTSDSSPCLTTSEIQAVKEFVLDGGGLVVVSEYEHDKYGNNLNELLEPMGLCFENNTVRDEVRGVNEEKTHVVAQAAGANDGIAIGVTGACFYRACTINTTGSGRPIYTTSASARPGEAALIAVSEFGKGRVAAIADSDVFGDQFIERYAHLNLWINLLYWVSFNAFARGQRQRVASPSVRDDLPEGWLELKGSIEDLRVLHWQERQPDNSYRTFSENSARIGEIVAEITKILDCLRESFPHQREYFATVQKDFQGWREADFGKPNFEASLAAFNPQSLRRENIRHLAVFPLYTPNNSLDIFFEALVIQVPWYDWLAKIERERFNNGKFVPGQLVDYTVGYESECAVLFPETVSVTGSTPNEFGIIFCDREGERYQQFFRRCAEIVRLNVQPDLKCFVASLELVQDMFALWDLIHDTSHALGPLPFDPFMIRQLAPYWMYGLEELRVDLRSVRAGIALSNGGFPFGKTVGYGVLFDRIFRFPITGSRIKNYDGLGGQLLFAALHKKKVLAWENNELRADWDRIFDAMTELSRELESFYDEGADQSRVRFYVEGHKFVSRYLKPNINSKWQRPEEIKLPEEDFRAWIGEALPDEFPLGRFHLQLKKRLEASE